MTPAQFNSLNSENKTLASEAYIDGFAAALEQVKSNKIRVGNLDLDEQYAAAISIVACNLAFTLERLKASVSSTKEQNVLTHLNDLEETAKGPTTK